MFFIVSRVLVDLLTTSNTVFDSQRTMFCLLFGANYLIHPVLLSWQRNSLILHLRRRCHQWCPVMIIMTTMMYSD